MIYGIGIDSDKTFIHFLRGSARHDINIQAINLRAVIHGGDWRLSIPDDGNSYIAVDNERILLDPKSGFFCRIIDLSTVQNNPTSAGLWRAMVMSINAWLENASGLIINRPGGHAHNFAKPLHEEFLRRCGFNVPPSITSSNKDQLEQFAKKNKVVIKPVSGVRANSRLVNSYEFRAYDPCQGPIHLQKYIEGDDVRVHVVGDKVHVELICSDGVDYRGNTGVKEFSLHHLPDSLCKEIIDVTANLGLFFAGWDFKLAKDGKYFCLEANPMPGYDSYDHRLGWGITDSLLEALTSIRCNPIMGLTTSNKFFVTDF